MTTTENPIHLITDHPLVGQWTELSDYIDRLEGQVPLSWELPQTVRIALTGEAQRSAPAVAALGVGQMAIIVVDDILDNDPKGIYRSIGAGRAANIAAALQAISLDLIQAAALTPPRKRMAIYYLNSMMSQTAYGQSLDVLNPADEESYWQLVQHKSTPFYATAFALGAIFADAAPALIDAICKLGMVYGEMIQIHDDIKDSLSNPADPDWLEGRNSLPILFASIVQHPEQGQFLALREHIEQTENLREAQDILVRSGAISYCLDQLVIKYSEAQVLLAQTPAQKPELLSALFDELVEPMKELLETGGMSIPSALARIS